MALGSLRVLRNRNYALLWWSGAVSDIGNWMQAVAVAALVVDLTQQARWAGFVAAASFLAAGLVTPFGGVLADRRDRRRVLIGSALALAGLAVVLAVMFQLGNLSPGVLVAVTAAEGTLVALAIPARGAMLPDLVERDDVLAAASLGAASWNLGRVIGPALGGVLIAVGSYSWVFLFNATTFVGVAVAMLLVRLPRHHDDGSDESVFTRLRDGFLASHREPACRGAIRTIAVTAVTVSPFIALIPAMAQLVFDGNAADTARLVTAQGVGAVAGALLLPVVADRVGRMRAVVGSLFLLPVAAIAFAVAPSMLVAMVALLVLGMLYIAVLSGLSTIVQLRAPAQFRARVISVFMMTLGIAYPIGAGVQGWLGDHFGVREVLGGGALIFLILLSAAALLRPALLTDLDSSSDD